ncbi:hypothetical protein VTK56DRAFT_814 [Thermocarpiscus australiensis]
MASEANDVDEPGALDFVRLIATLVTSQNSCPVHEACDSSCQHRLGVRRYRLMPNGERQGEADMRAQLAAMNLNAEPAERTEPLTIPADVPIFTYSPLPRPDGMIRLLRLKRLRAGFLPGQREEYLGTDAICINQQDTAEKRLSDPPHGAHLLERRHRVRRPRRHDRLRSHIRRVHSSASRRLVWGHGRAGQPHGVGQSAAPAALQDGLPSPLPAVVLQDVGRPGSRPRPAGQGPVPRQRLHAGPP